ncbi:MFS general substrate transporter [Trametes maxima]|nr:MFS general substrate transporter [Trametes maxima]
MRPASDDGLSLSEKGPSSGIQLDTVEDLGVTEQRRVLRKLDFRLLPFVCFLFVLSFLDRANIGNAKVAGLSADLHLTGTQYSLCAAMFFIPYCLFEVPSNITLKLTSPSKWLPTTMFCWGSVMISMAFVRSFAGLLTARLFLGMTESGLFPGVTFYLCTWYPKAEQAKRIAIFSSASSIAGAFGGLLAFAIEKMDGIGGLAGWSWIFLLEGLLTVLVAIIAYFVMYDYPENATFLTQAERTWLIVTLKRDNTGLSKDFQWKFLLQALRDPHTYMMVALFFFIFVPSYAFTLFLPTLIAALGFSASMAQLLSVPPNLAGALFTVLAGVLSDRFRVRGPLVLAGTTLALVGYVVLYATASPGAGYAGTIVAACGIYPTVACILAWTGANVGGEAKRAVVLAMVIGCGNLGGIASSFIYRPQDSPRYHLGHAVNIGCLCVSILISLVAMLDFARLNRKKAAQCARDCISEGKMGDFNELGDSSPLYRSVGKHTFRYTTSYPVPYALDLLDI